MSRFAFIHGQRTQRWQDLWHLLGFIGHRWTKGSSRLFKASNLLQAFRMLSVEKYASFSYDNRECFFPTSIWYQQPVLMENKTDFRLPLHCTVQDTRSSPYLFRAMHTYCPESSVWTPEISSTTKPKSFNVFILEPEREWFTYELSRAINMTSFRWKQPYWQAMADYFSTIWSAAWSHLLVSRCSVGEHYPTL